MDNCILQWNINGFYNNFNELKLMINDFNPFAICIQESHFNHSRRPTLKNYSIFYKLDQFHMRASGGVAICVKHGFHAEELDLNTDLQAVAVKMFYPLEFTLVSLYLPPDQQIQRADLDDLLQQLTTPFLVTTDCNAHNVMWGSRQNNSRGKILESIINDWNLNILNDGSHTHFSVGNNSYSAIDISFGSPCLSNQFSWTVHTDLCSSDHFPILISPLSRMLNTTRRPRWLTSSADWNKYQNNVTLNLDGKDLTDPLNQVDHFTSSIINAAKQSIPQTSSIVKKCKPPWWCKEVNDCIKARNKALSMFNQKMDSESEKIYKIAKAKARRIIRQHQRNSWQKYASTIDNSTPVKEVWSKVQKISGKTNFQGITCLKNGTDLIHSPEAIAEEMGKNFSLIASSSAYSPEFIQHRSHAQNNDIILFEEIVQSDLNINFTMQELQIALKSCKGSSTGPDNMHYDMLKNLPIDAHFYLLRMLNNIWNQRTFPAQWRESIVIPIKKPSKNPLNPKSYRPISLTSCVSKIFEKMINRRLMWYLESNELLDNTQSGFRKYRSTLDNLAVLENDVQETFQRREHLVCIFFDLEKAYDTTWRFNIIKTLSSYGVRGNMLYFIHNFLQDRTFRVAIGNTFSSQFVQENGVPQGSVLSVTLFLVAMNSLKSFIPEGVKNYKFADDVAAYISGKSLVEIEQRLQTTLQNLENWSKTTGFRFSVGKTKIIHFCRKTSCNTDPHLTLHGQEIEVVNTHKFLGMTFDRKLNWDRHLKNAKARSIGAVKVIRTLSNTNWGSNRKILLNLHNSLVLSRLEYGSVVYNSASATRLKSLDPVHHLGVRLATGAYRTSPTISVLCDAGMMPLSFRRELQTLAYGIKSIALCSHVLHTKMRDINSLTSNTTSKSLVQRFKTLCSKYNIKTENIHNRGFHSKPPWTVGELEVDLTLSRTSKLHIAPVMCQKEFLSRTSEYNDFYFIYTDGSKLANNVGCAVFSTLYQRQLHLSNETSIFSAELIAIKNAIECAIQDDLHYKFLIISDSMSSLKAIQDPFSENPLIQELHELLLLIRQDHKIIKFLWTPSHRGIPGNEIVDELAKEATHIQQIQTITTHRDQINASKYAVRCKWLQFWENIENNKLRSIKTSILQWNTSYCLQRKDSIVITRLRIGHTKMTHEYIFKREDPPQCIDCKTPLTVDHIINFCPKYAIFRVKYNINSQSLSDDLIRIKDLLKFLRESNLYNEI